MGKQGVFSQNPPNRSKQVVALAQALVASFNPQFHTSIHQAHQKLDATFNLEFRCSQCNCKGVASTKAHATLVRSFRMQAAPARFVAVWAKEINTRCQWTASWASYNDRAHKVVTQIPSIEGFCIVYVLLPKGTRQESAESQSAKQAKLHKTFAKLWGVNSEDSAFSKTSCERPVSSGPLRDIKAKDQATLAKCRPLNSLICSEAQDTQRFP